MQGKGYANWPSGHYARKRQGEWSKEEYASGRRYLASGSSFGKGSYQLICGESRWVRSTYERDFVIYCQLAGIKIDDYERHRAPSLERIKTCWSDFEVNNKTLSGRVE